MENVCPQLHSILASPKVQSLLDHVLDTSLIFSPQPRAMVKLGDRLHPEAWNMSLRSGICIDLWDRR